VKITRLLLLVAFMGISCSVALADGTDPVFKLGPGGQSVDLTSNTFSFTVSESQAFAGLVTLDFINHTGSVIQELDLLGPANTTPNNSFPNGIALSFACDNTVPNPYFNNCSPQTLTGGPATVSFFGLDEGHHGIPTATSVSCPEGPNSCFVTGGDVTSDFMIRVDVSTLQTGWGAFDVEGTFVPMSTAEPSTLLMVLAAGLGFLVVKRSGFAI
jgi:hypothetical protein